MSESENDAAQRPSRDNVIAEAVATLQQAAAAGYVIRAHELPALLRVPYGLNKQYTAEAQP
jgi:hypothetical protein